MADDDYQSLFREGTNVEDKVATETEEGDLLPPDETDVEVLRNVCNESRAVLDHRIDKLREVDEKAIQIIRASVLFISILVSGAAIAGLDKVKELDGGAKWSFGVGIIGFVFTSIYGVYVYTDSEEDYGPDKQFRNESRKAIFNEKEWLTQMLIGYDEWVQNMKNVNDRNTSQLFLLQIIFVASLLCILAAITLFYV